MQVSTTNTRDATPSVVRSLDNSVGVRVILRNRWLCMGIVASVTRLGISVDSRGRYAHGSKIGVRWKVSHLVEERQRARGCIMLMYGTQMYHSLARWTLKSVEACINVYIHITR